MDHRLIIVALSGLASAAAGQTSNLYSTHPTPQGAFGGAVSQAPDFTGDGKPDIMVGAAGEAVGPTLIAGRVTIHSSVDGAIVRTLVSPAPETYGYFGSAVALVPDFTGDGKPDIAVGAYGENNGGVPTSGKGRVYLFDGATAALVRTLENPSGAKGSRFGAAIAGMEDINGDGRGDILVGAPIDLVNGIQSGRVNLFSGADGVLLRRFSRAAPGTYDYFGISVASVPDTTGDGRPEIAIGAPGVTNKGFGRAGTVYLFNGVTWGFIRPMCPEYAIVEGSFGASVSGVPDVNGDGRGEIVIGAPGEQFNNVAKAGRVYLFDGKTGYRLRVLGLGSPEYYGHFGSTVAGVPDSTGDGKGDIVVGAPFVNHAGIEDSGRIYLYSGATGAYIRGQGSPAPVQYGYFGNALAGLVDINANNKGEILVGGPNENTKVQTCGRAYLLRN